MRYRFWRCPTGVVAEAEEMAGEAGINLDGYHFKVLGDHEADLRPLIASLRTVTAEGIAHAHLEQHSGWLLIAGEELEGRLVWDDAGDIGMPYAVVVDGRRLSWAEFGRALEPFEGVAVPDPGTGHRAARLGVRGDHEVAGPRLDAQGPLTARPWVGRTSEG